VSAPRRPSPPASEAGFSLVEMLVSVGLMVVITGAAFQLAAGGHGGFRSQPEVADMQQRLRVAADMLYKDLLMAGAGPYHSPAVGALASYLPPLQPRRTGAVGADGALTYAADRITVLYVPATRSQTRLMADMSSPYAALDVNPVEPGCPVTAAGGFAAGMRALVFDPSGVGGGYELFTVTGAGPTSLQHAAPNPDFTRAYQSGAQVSEVEHHVYYLDRSTSRLMHYNGHQSDLPLVDNVVDLQFTYYADPNPASVPQPPAGQANCVYDPGTPPVPKLANLGGTALKPLTASQLSDGPTCGLGVNQFDGDLLRVRKVRVGIRVQVAREDLRGSGADFTKGGASKSGQRYVPDYAVNFEVTPRNLNLIR
jgi:hypothetical protein